MCRHSVVAAFRNAQEKVGKEACSSAAASTWMKENRPKHCNLPSKA